jgi:hypothetical protein
MRANRSAIFALNNVQRRQRETTGAERSDNASIEARYIALYDRLNLGTKRPCSCQFSKQLVSRARAEPMQERDSTGETLIGKVYGGGRRRSIGMLRTIIETGGASAVRPGITVSFGR